MSLCHQVEGLLCEARVLIINAREATLREKVREGGGEEEAEGEGEREGVREGRRRRVREGSK